MSLARSTVAFGGMTLISRVLGFARDVVLARWFGANAATDAFFAAFKIPNLLRRLFAEGSFSLAFVPVLAEYRERGDQAALKSLIDAVTGCLFAVLFVITAVGMLTAPWIVKLFPGFLDDPERLPLAGSMLRVMFPYLLLISLTALAGGILNTFGRFSLPALAPALLNISMIVAAIGFSAYFEVPIKALAWGVLVAGLLQLALLLPALARHGVLPWPKPDFRHPGVRRILKLMVPTLFGSSVAQINLLFDIVIASLLMTGSISWLYYADRLMEFPLGVFGVALSTVILPTLASLHARNNAPAFRSTLNWAMVLGLVIAIPAAVGLGMLALPIISTLFLHGEFTSEAARMAAWALTAYAFGLPAFIGVKILAPAYFSRQDTKTPVKIAVAALVANMVLNVIAVLAMTVWLAGGWPEGPVLEALAARPGAHVGLAAASSLAGYLNAGLLWWNLRGTGLTPHLPGRRMLQVALAAAAMAIVLVWVSPAADVWIGASIWQRAFWLTGSVFSGAMIYGLALLTAGLRPSMLHRPAPADS